MIVKNYGKLFTVCKKPLSLIAKGLLSDYPPIL